MLYLRYRDSTHRARLEARRRQYAKAIVALQAEKKGLEEELGRLRALVRAAEQQLLRVGAQCMPVTPVEEVEGRAWYRQNGTVARRRLPKGYAEHYPDA